MTLIARMTNLHDRLTGLPIRFGIPQHRPVVVVKEELPNGALFPALSYMLIDPLPTIQSVPLKLAGSVFSGQLVLSQDDLIVRGISRNLTREQLTQDVDIWLIDAQESGGVWSGLRCRCLHLDDSEPLTWKAILRREAEAR